MPREDNKEKLAKSMGEESIFSYTSLHNIKMLCECHGIIDALYMKKFLSDSTKCKLSAP
jgi:hypothetical protein